MANDLCYSPHRQLLFASIRPDSPAYANSIVAIDPATGAVTVSIPLDGNPGLMAASEDGVSLYVELKNGPGIRRIRLSDFTVEPELFVDYSKNLSQTQSAPEVSIHTMRVRQGSGDTLIVSFRSSSGLVGVAAFRKGERLPEFISINVGLDTFCFGADSETLWSKRTYHDSALLYRLRVNDQGISVAEGPWTGVLGGLVYGYGGFESHDGLIYTGTGPPHVFDPVTRTVLGTFLGQPGFGFFVDGEQGRIYYANGDGWVRMFYSFDVRNYTLTGYYAADHRADEAMPRFAGTVFRGCGPKYMAMIDGDNNNVLLYPRSMLEPYPVPPAAVVELGGGARALTLENDGVLFHPPSGRLLAATPNLGGGNSVVPIDPITLKQGEPVWAGSNPQRMALTGDGRHLYVQLTGASYIQRFDMRTFEPDLRIPLRLPDDIHPAKAWSIEPLPGTAESVVVPISGSIGIYDGTVRRPLLGEWAQTARTDDHGGRLFTFGQEIDTFPFVVYGITSDGLRPASRVSLPWGTLDEIFCQGSLCIQSSGLVIDNDSSRVLGFCPSGVDGILNAGLMTGVASLDVARRRAYFVRHSDDYKKMILNACDLDRFVMVEEVVLPVAGAFPVDLREWREDQFVFSSHRAVVTVPKAALQPLPPTPLPQPQRGVGAAQFLRLKANAAVYDRRRDRLLVAVHASAGTYGNSIAIVNPATARVERTFAVGGKPVRLSLSDDGSGLYVELAYTRSVVRVDLATERVDQRILLPAPLTAMRAVPGRPEAVVLAYGGLSGVESAVAVYEGGQMTGRRQVLATLPPTSLEFGESAEVLYGAADSHKALMEFALEGADVRLVREVANYETGRWITYGGGRLYDEKGRVFDASTLKRVDQVGANRGVAAVEKGAWLAGLQGDRLFVYRLPELTLDGSWASRATWRGVVECGPNRVALIDPDSQDGLEIYSIDQMERPTPLAAQVGADGAIHLAAQATSIGYDSGRGRLLVATPAELGPDGNKLLAVDPATGAVMERLRTGSQPRLLSVDARRGRALVGMTASAQFGWLDLTSGATLLQCATPGLDYRGGRAELLYAVGGVALADEGYAAALALRIAPDSSQSFVAALDGCEARPEVENEMSYISRLEDGGDGMVYGGPNFGWPVTPAGISKWKAWLLPDRNWQDWAVCGGLVYTSGGLVFDPVKGEVVRDFWPEPMVQSRGQAVGCSVEQDRVDLVATGGGDGYQLAVSSFRLSTGEALGTAQVRVPRTTLKDVVVAGQDTALLDGNGEVTLVPGAMRK